MPKRSPRAAPLPRAGRLATEQGVAQLVLFLASAANTSVTGAEIRVGHGGQRKTRPRN